MRRRQQAGMKVVKRWFTKILCTLIQGLNMAKCESVKVKVHLEHGQV